jgi:hypothetical protein
MPSAQNPVVTTNVVSSGLVTAEWDVELPPGFTGFLAPNIPIVTQQIAVNNLPKLWVWIRQTSGPAVATFQPMYANGTRRNANADSEPGWQPITPDQTIMAFNVPTNWNCVCRFPILAFGVRLTNPDLEQSVRLTVVLGACQ